MRMASASSDSNHLVRNLLEYLFEEWNGHSAACLLAYTLLLTLRPNHDGLVFVML